MLCISRSSKRTHASSKHSSRHTHARAPTHTCTHTHTYINNVERNDEKAACSHWSTGSSLPKPSSNHMWVQAYLKARSCFMLQQWLIFHHRFFTGCLLRILTLCLPLDELTWIKCSSTWILYDVLIEVRAFAAIVPAPKASASLRWNLKQKTIFKTLHSFWRPPLAGGTNQLHQQDGKSFS